MRIRSMILLPVIAVALASCGGSSSESPWPVEPQGAALGPAGEAPGASSEGGESEGASEREEPAPANDQSAGEKDTTPKRGNP